MPQTNTLNKDLDQSGTAFQRVKVYMGPSLGWQETFVTPSVEVTVPGAFFVKPGTTLVLVNALGVNVVLPDVVAWLKETAYQPAVGFERAIWVKDFIGQGATTNIAVTTTNGQRIDGGLLATINTNFGILRIYPIHGNLGTASGWFIG